MKNKCAVSLSLAFLIAMAFTAFSGRAIAQPNGSADSLFNAIIQAQVIPVLYQRKAAVMIAVMEVKMSNKSRVMGSLYFDDSVAAVHLPQKEWEYLTPGTRRGKVILYPMVVMQCQDDVQFYETVAKSNVALTALLNKLALRRQVSRIAPARTTFLETYY